MMDSSNEEEYIEEEVEEEVYEEFKWQDEEINKEEEEEAETNYDAYSEEETDFFDDAYGYDSSTESVSSVEEEQEEDFGELEKGLKMEVGYEPDEYAKIKHVYLLPPNNLYEISKLTLYEKKYQKHHGGKGGMGVTFCGISLEWTHRDNGDVVSKRTVDPAGEEAVAAEITQIDFIQAISYAGKKDRGIMYLNLDGYLTDCFQAGNANLFIEKVCAPLGKMLHGLKITKVGEIFAHMRPFWQDVTDQLPVDESFDDPWKTPFLLQVNKANNAFVQRKVYSFRGTRDRYVEFSSLGTKGDAVQKEYLGGLMIRFLSKDEQIRLKKIKRELKLKELFRHIKNQGIFTGPNHHLVESNKKLCIRLLADELFLSDRNKWDTDSNTRFVCKVLCIVYWDNEPFWKAVTDHLKPIFDRKKQDLFGKIWEQLTVDPGLLDLQQQVKNYEDPLVKGKIAPQKECPQKIDIGIYREQDMGALAKKYIKEAGKYIIEWHGLMRENFPKHYIGAPVKGYSRIMTKCVEYKKEKNISASDALANVLDYIRGTIKCRNCAEMIQAFQKLKFICAKDPNNFKIVRVKNGFQDISKQSYKSLMVNIMIYGAMIGEIQVTLDLMKEVGNFDHFIYETVREKTLFDVVSKFLNNLTPYKEWLEPFLDFKQVLKYPERAMQWKGFKLKDGHRISWAFNMQLFDNGKVTGFGKCKKGEYKLEGTHKDNYKHITFTETVEGNGKKKTILYKGHFVDCLTVEGEYFFGKTSNKFRIWISDELCPGLSVIQGDQKKKKKLDPLPEEYLTWKGYYIQCGEQGDMTDMSIIFDKNGKVLGKGADDNGPFIIDGTHRNYSEVSFMKKMDFEGGWTIFYDGQFNGKSLEGLYMLDADIGKFKLWIEDERHPIPKEEEEEEDTYPEKPLRWTGYYVENREQGPMELALTLYKDGSIDGESVEFYEDEEEYLDITGKHENFSKIYFKVGESIEYKGQFVEYGHVEGLYTNHKEKVSGKFKISLVK